MNRLVIIGNGFDLAHGLKSSYKDFIRHYILWCYNLAFKNGKYNDDLIEITCVVNHIQIGKMRTVDELIKYYFETNIGDFIFNKLLLLPEWSNHYKNPFETVVKTQLFAEMLTQCMDSNWVGIENHFYRKLKWALKLNNEKDKIENVIACNLTIRSMIIHLVEYLSSLPEPKYIQDYVHVFSSSIKAEEVVYKGLNVDIQPRKTLFLNFNYTNTIEQYITVKSYDNSGNPSDVNYIHGKLSTPKNPIIFGFGDEIDEDYKEIELQNVNFYFDYIKSFWYFKTSNYHNLIRFIDVEDYQVLIIGHSCGLSDRTMLNMILEHENCKSIKIFYHERNDGHNNFDNITRELSRHFKDKSVMRRKIVSFNHSSPLPSIKNS